MGEGEGKTQIKAARRCASVKGEETDKDERGCKQKKGDVARESAQSSRVRDIQSEGQE